MTERAPQSAGNKPLLVFKVGILGCVPLDMPARLAEEFDMKFVSSEEVHKQIVEQGLADGLPVEKATKFSSNRQRRILVSQATEHLTGGHDVMMDVFYNKQNTRRVPLDLCERMGAASIALTFDVSLDQAMKRVQQWTEDGEFKLPVSYWRVPPYQATLASRKHLEWPSQEGIDYVFRMNGGNDTDDLLDQFERHMRWADLAD